MKHFSAPRESFGGLDAETAASLIAAASDIALVVDAHGIVRDAAFQDEALFGELMRDKPWLGRPFLDTVTVESRAKVQTMLTEAASNGTSRPRQINHASPQRADVAILYTAMRIGDDGRVMMFGRDLQTISDLQYRLVEAQQSMERDYSRLRNVEMRYRLLFQESVEPVLMVDVATRKVLEANAAAATFFGAEAARIIGRSFLDIFEDDSREPVRAMLVGVQAAGRSDDVRATVGRGRDGGADATLVSASILRQESGSLFVIRLSALGAEAPAAALPKMTWKLLKLVETAPDGFVVTDPEGTILSANAAFLDMAELATEQQARDEPLDRWPGRQGVDLGVLVANLRQHGSVRLFASTLRGDFGSVSDVEISAVSVMNSERQCLGFVIRNVSRRLRPEPRGSVASLPQSVGHLTELVGRVSLKDLVREATDVIERLSIEAALEMTGDNRASAAEMLGLSRQSLYVKLRRYGMIDPAAEPDNGEA